MPVEVTWSMEVKNTIWIKFSGRCGVQDVYESMGQIYTLGSPVDFGVVLLMDFLESSWKVENYLPITGYIERYPLATRKSAIAVGLSPLFKSLSKIAVRINSKSVIEYTVDTLDEAHDLIRRELST
jgi:hypothetical protein